MEADRLAPASGLSGSVRLWIRLSLYALAIPVLAVVPIGLRKPGPWAAALVGICLLLIVAGAWQVGRRSAVGRALGSSRALRAADAGLWNLLLALLLMESLLTLADLFIDHPLLTRPDGKSVRRTADYRPPAHHWVKGARTNSGGYNDTEWATPRPEDSIRIVALGDSFAFGVVGYEANFLTLLEADLSRRLGANVEVVNLGIGGLMPRDYLFLLNDEGLALQPDLVLVCFFVGNDFNRARQASYLHLGSWRIHAFARRVLRLLAERRRRVGGAPDLGAEPRDATAGDPETPTFSEEAYLEIARSYLPQLLSGGGGGRVEGDTLRVLEQIAALARPRPVVIAVLPNEVQVNPSLRERVLAAEGLSEAELDLHRPGRLLRRHFEPLGVTVIDLLPDLVAAEAEGGTYRLRDSHWNARGNRIAASAMAPVLEPIVRELTR